MGVREIFDRCTVDIWWGSCRYLIDVPHISDGFFLTYLMGFLDIFLGFP